MEYLKRLVGYGLVVGLGVLLTIQLRDAVLGASLAEKRVCLGLQPVELNAQAPDWSLTDLAGKKHSLSDYKGRTLLLHFWFTQCPPCIEELPSLVHMAARMAGNKKFEVVTVNVDDNIADVKAFAKKHKLGGLPILYDKSKKVPRSYGTLKFPESYLIDGSGVVRYRFVNKRNWESHLARACIATML
ncbi:MAG: TlpA family protein disulfide reductase [Myxococcales bacterium]|nr:TlpA family protein disulfide reductase [Myxococcales bacterium]